MANGKSIKTLRKVVEGEHLAANALAVASGKAKDLDLQKFLSDLGLKHENNALNAGSRLKELGGKYPTPGLRDALKKGWESVATTKTPTEAVKLLQKKEREAVTGYKLLVKKAADDHLLSLVANNLADTTDNLVALGDKLKQLQSKKKGKRILGLPRILWLIALVAGITLVVRRRLSGSNSNASSTGTPAGDSNNS